MLVYLYTYILASICICIPVSIEAIICICIPVSKLVFVSVEVSADEFEDELECISALQTLKTLFNYAF